MKIQSNNRFDNTFLSLSVVILVLLAAFLIAPNALAGQCFDKDGNLKPHAKPGCSTPNPFPADESFNQAMFDDAYIAVNPQSFTRANPNFDRGDYLADNPGSREVQISTTSLSKTTLKGKRDDDLCHKLDQRGAPPFSAHPDSVWSALAEAADMTGTLEGALEVCQRVRANPGGDGTSSAPSSTGSLR